MSKMLAIGELVTNLWNRVVELEESNKTLADIAKDQEGRIEKLEGSSTSEQRLKQRITHLEHILNINLAAIRPRIERLEGARQAEAEDKEREEKEKHVEGIQYRVIWKEKLAGLDELIPFSGRVTTNFAEALHASIIRNSYHNISEIMIEAREKNDKEWLRAWDIKGISET